MQTGQGQTGGSVARDPHSAWLSPLDRVRGATFGQAVVVDRGSAGEVVHPLRLVSAFLSSADFVAEARDAAEVVVFRVAFHEL